MANGTFLGQQKLINVDGGGSTRTATITPANFSNGTSLVLAPDATNHNANALFAWNGGSWNFLSGVQATVV